MTQKSYIYDDNGNMIQETITTTTVVNRDFDEEGRLIHIKDGSNGFEEFHEYDENGNEIRSYSNNGYEANHSYDTNGNQIYTKVKFSDDNVIEEWTTFDENGNPVIVRQRADDRFIMTCKKYDDDGRIIEELVGSAPIEEIDDVMTAEIEPDHIHKWEYDEVGNEIYHESSFGFWEKKEYDDKCRVIHTIQHSDPDDFTEEEWNEYGENYMVSKNSNGSETRTEYDDNGNELHRILSGVLECWWEYDDNGNLIKFSNSHGYSEEYTYNENGKLKCVCTDNTCTKFDNDGNVIYHAVDNSI